MTHHGWIAVTGESVPAALLSPFGRLFPARGLQYNSHAISLLAGAHGPLEERIIRDKKGDPVFKNGEVETVTIFKSKKPALPTGFTFLGQFIDHDSTEFRVASPELRLLLQNPTIDQRQRVHEDGPPTTTNGRSGRIDLDSVYGLLGSIDLQLFGPDGKFLNRKDGAGVAIDIQRPVDFRDGRLIADPRNDENKIIVQLHILFERLHDQLHVGTNGANDDQRRSEISATRLKVVNAFRRIILFDYLPRVVGVDRTLAVWQQIKANTSFYQSMNRRVRLAVLPMLQALVDGIPAKDGKPSKAPEVLQEYLDQLVAMPVEFAHAAFRLGHTQLRDAYKLNAGNPVVLFATGPYGTKKGPAIDLRGNGKIGPDTLIDWTHLFGPAASMGRPLDANLPTSIFRLPPPPITEPPVSLAERNIRRGVDFGLPSGQEVARMLGNTYGAKDVPILTADQILPPYVLDEFPEIRTIDAQFAVATPLWFYILREASELAPNDTHLGPVGGLIVAETLLGALSASSKDFDMAQYLDGNYATDVTAAEASTSSGANADDIKTMRNLLNFIGTNV